VSGFRYLPTLSPLIAARAALPRAATLRQWKQLRGLKRRVAAARLGEGSLQRITRQWPTEDLQ
jgi:hypothetical protein